ncbi:MAG: sigma 54-interacting transcriptional regulator [Desulfotalea sp.]
MKKEILEQNIKRSIIFQELSDTEIKSCAKQAEVRIVTEGNTIYEQGSLADYFFIIAMGEAELIMNLEDGSSSVVGRIGPGGHFGETALISGKSHIVSIRALFDIVLIAFKKEFFFNELMTKEKFRQRIEISLSERLRVSFADQADMSRKDTDPHDIDSAGKMILFRGRDLSMVKASTEEGLKGKKSFVRSSRAARKTQAQIDTIAGNERHFFLHGEEGTGRSIIAKQIHAESSRADAIYKQLNCRKYKSLISLEKDLFGIGQDDFPFFRSRQAGYLEQTCGGTLVFNHIDLMPKVLQGKINTIIESGIFTHLDSNQQIAMQARLVFISHLSLGQLKESGKVIPELIAIFEKQNFKVPALREHKKDLPRLINHYLVRHSKESDKQVDKVSSLALGVLLNYDWPGNLTELSTVIRRAVMLCTSDEVKSEQILLGLPKTEGKWEFNLLRLPFIRDFLKSWCFPIIPQAIVGTILLLSVVALFLGSQEPRENLGLTVSWAIGWPLMFFSFFFLARMWCSICTLAMPGKVLQDIFKPKRKTPRFIKHYSGWIMTIFCILVFWVEIVWDAYTDPILTGWIILAVTVGSIIFSLMYSRRAWCRYLCPLGAVNAIFAMPSILELRSNRHVCLNKCQVHACFGGTDETKGCPMFRHPYLVDNNRDCIFCADCIKNCNNHSIQLNLRLAPQELWEIQSPRLADSFLIVALGAIFFPFSLHSGFSTLAGSLVMPFQELLEVSVSQHLASSIIFFTQIFISLVIFYILVSIQARISGYDKKKLLALLGYGLIPLILGSYLAVHFHVFIDGAGLIIPQIMSLMGNDVSYENWQIMNPDSTKVLQIISVLGGLLASFYATYRIIDRTISSRKLAVKDLMGPFVFLTILSFCYLYML